MQKNVNKLLQNSNIIIKYQSLFHDSITLLSWTVDNFTSLVWNDLEDKWFLLKLRITNVNCR